MPISNKPIKIKTGKPCNDVPRLISGLIVVPKTCLDRLPLDNRATLMERIVSESGAGEKVYRFDPTPENRRLLVMPEGF